MFFVGRHYPPEVADFFAPLESDHPCGELPTEDGVPWRVVVAVGEV